VRWDIEAPFHRQMQKTAGHENLSRGVFVFFFIFASYFIKKKKIN